MSDTYEILGTDKHKKIKFNDHNEREKSKLSLKCSSDVFYNPIIKKVNNLEEIFNCL